MGVVIIDGSTMRDFVSNEAQFKKSVDERFAAFDLNNDGVLSRGDLRKAFEPMRLLESHFSIDVVTTPDQLSQLYDSIFEKFDCDRSGTVDVEEFRAEMKKIMLAIADGLGSCDPVPFRWLSRMVMKVCLKRLQILRLLSLILRPPPSPSPNPHHSLTIQSHCFADASSGLGF